MNQSELMEVIEARVLLTDPRAALYMEFKSYEYFRNTLRRLVRTLYDGWIGGDFVQTMSNLITGQIIDAHVRAWFDETGGEENPPLYLQLHAQSMAQKQEQFIEPYYVAILDARIEQSSIEPLLARADLWANRWNEAYTDAVQYITEQSGGKLEWVLGATEKHCPLCSAYNGIVAYATDWSTARVAPRNAPNHALTGVYEGDKGCEGWRCDCDLVPTDKRRTPKALDKIMTIVLSKS